MLPFLVAETEALVDILTVGARLEPSDNRSNVMQCTPLEVSS
jgi:hypothetical protein